MSAGAGARASETHAPGGRRASHAGARGTSGDGAPGPDGEAAGAIDAALDQLGPFGLYQRYTLFLLCIPSFLGAMYSLNYVFVADVVPFRCVVPECEGTEGVQYSSPAAAALAPQPCLRLRPLLPPGNVTCQREHYHAVDTEPCDTRVYLHRDTIYAEFDLGCREWLRTLVGTVRNAALPLALLLTGYVSDSYGRRAALCLFAACAGVLGVVKGFSVDYRMYLAMEFLEAALGYGFTSAAYVMMLELARPSLRTTYACASGAAYGLGGAALALAAWAAGHWRRLLWLVYSPALLLPLYRLLLHDSCRWLHASGRRDRAARVIRKAARWNKVTLDEEVMKRLVEEEEGGERAGGGNPWWSPVRSRALLLRFAACSWCWVSVAFVYYGLTINSVALAGDKYVNFALNMAMEVVASLLLVMALERFGRKWSIFVAFVVCGVACAAPFFVESPGAVLGLYFTGKLSITFAFNSMYVWTAELFPTRVRSSALAACSLVGRAGSVLAPQTPLLGAALQAALYAGCSALAALAVLAAPETWRAPLPRDVAAAERLARPAPPLPPAPPPPAPRVLAADA